MKFFLVALMCMMMTTVAYADDTPIPVEALPAAAKAFVAQHFPQNKIIYAEKDWRKYEAHLDNGTEVEFNRKGVWDKVDCHMTAVPAAIIPANITAYVTANFPNCIITKIDKERHGFDVELSNDIELKFNKAGVLIGMDD